MTRTTDRRRSPPRERSRSHRGRGSGARPPAPAGRGDARVPHRADRASGRRLRRRRRRPPPAPPTIVAPLRARRARPSRAGNYADAARRLRLGRRPGSRPDRTPARRSGTSPAAGCAAATAPARWPRSTTCCALRRLPRRARRRRSRDGLQRMEQGDLPGAQAAFERMIHEQPDSELVPLAHALIARIHWAHGEPMETVRAFARMFASVQDTVPAYARLAHYLERYADGDTNVTGYLRRPRPDGRRGLPRHLPVPRRPQPARAGPLRGDATRRSRRCAALSRTATSRTSSTSRTPGTCCATASPAEALAIFERLEQTPAAGERTGASTSSSTCAPSCRMGIARCQLALGHDARGGGGLRTRARRDRPQHLRGRESRRPGDRVRAPRPARPRRRRAPREVIDEHPDEPSGWALRQQLARVEERLAAPAP